MCDLIPLSVLELDHPEPAGGWAQLLDREGVELVEDDIGRPAVTANDARLLLGAHRAEEAYRAEEHARRLAERERKMAEFAARYPVLTGIPASDAGNAMLDMLASGGDEPSPTVGSVFGETAGEADYASSSTRRERWIQDGPVGRWVPDDA